jgi:hypothetical protein
MRDGRKVRKRGRACIIFEEKKKTEVREKWREVKLDEENAKSITMKRMKMKWEKKRDIQDEGNVRRGQNVEDKNEEEVERKIYQ